MPEPFDYDVFLSHSSVDQPRVRRLAEQLRDAGLRVWLDEWAVQVGDDIYLSIERGLERSRCLVLCLSRAALRSEWVALERSAALFRDPTNRDRRFLPVLLDDCELPDTLRRYRYVDLRQDDPESLAPLIAAARSPSTTQAPPRATPAAKPKTPKFLLKLAGLVVAIALIVSFGLLLWPTPFALTVYVHGPGGVHQLPLRNVGAVLLDLGPDRRRAPISEKGEAYFMGIPASFRGQEVPVAVEADGFEILASDARKTLDPQGVYIEVRKRGAVFRGHVQDPDGYPIEGALVTLCKLEVPSDAKGEFEIHCPGDRLSEANPITVSKPGFVVWRGQAVPGSNDLVAQLVPEP